MVYPKTQNAVSFELKVTNEMNFRATYKPISTYESLRESRPTKELGLPLADIYLLSKETLLICHVMYNVHVINFYLFSVFEFSALKRQDHHIFDLDISHNEKLQSSD